MKIKKKIGIFTLFFSLSLIAQPIGSWANEPVDDDGVTAETCDVRTNADNASNPPEHSLRHRLNLFNGELDDSNQPTGQGKCLFGIYFLEPMTIKLKDRLLIRAIETTLQDGENQAGTYISGLNSQSQPLPIVIDGRFIPLQDEQGKKQCAFMIEDGLSTFQQIHDITILVWDKTRAICDDEGNDLLEQAIPANTSRNCDEGTLAKDCDFKGVIIEKSSIKFPTNPDKDGDGILNADDKCPDDSDNDGNGNNIDADNDGLADACEDDFLNDQDNDGYPDGEDLCDDGVNDSSPTYNFPESITDAFSNDQGFRKGPIGGLSNSPYAKRVPPTEVDDPSLDIHKQAAEKLKELLEAGTPLPTTTIEGCSEKLRQDEDQDEDGQGDACDDDVDGDTLLNDDDPYPCAVDGDGDTIPDVEDQCPHDPGVLDGLNGKGCPGQVVIPQPPVDDNPPFEPPVDTPQDEDPNPQENQDSSEVAFGGSRCSLGTGKLNEMNFVLVLTMLYLVGLGIKRRSIKEE